MKRTFLILIMVVLSSLAIAQTNVFYYVNIDNAPNGSAIGTMQAYMPGWNEPVASTGLVFLENYL